MKDEWGEKDDGYCPTRKDETHCNCWWDDGKCCSCGYEEAENET